MPWRERMGLKRNKNGKNHIYFFAHFYELNSYGDTDINANNTWIYQMLCNFLCSCFPAISWPHLLDHCFISFFALSFAYFLYLHSICYLLYNFLSLSPPLFNLHSISFFPDLTCGHLCARARASRKGRKARPLILGWVLLALTGL